MARVIDADPYETGLNPGGAGALQCADGEADPWSGEEPLDMHASGETEDEDQFISRPIPRIAQKVSRARKALKFLQPLAARAVASAVPGGALISLIG